MSDLVILIPARRNSRGVPRKNLRSLTPNSSLVGRAITSAQSFIYELNRDNSVPPRDVSIWVGTDDPDIMTLARHRRVKVWKRPDVPADETIDQTQLAFAHHLEGSVYAAPTLLILQPTVHAWNGQLIGKELHRFYMAAILIGSPPTVDRPHVLTLPFSHQIYDSDGNQLLPPVNRQDVPKDQKLSAALGVYLTPFGESIAHPRPIRGTPNLIDIDDPIDMHAARFTPGITFWVSPHGRGHLTRSVALAVELSEYEPKMAVAPQHRSYVHDHNLKTIDHHSPFSSTQTKQLLVVDGWADSNSPYRHQFHIENRNPDTNRRALIHIDPLGNPDHRRYGVLRPPFNQFGSSPPDPDNFRVVVTWGGDDESGYAQAYSVEKLNARTTQGVEFVSASEYPTLADAFFDSRAVLSSAGRTVFEIAACTRFAFVVPQTSVEQTHVHTGYGSVVIPPTTPPPTLVSQIEHYLTNQLDLLGARVAYDRRPHRGLWDLSALIEAYARMVA